MLPDPLALFLYCPLSGSPWPLNCLPHLVLLGSWSLLFKFDSLQKQGREDPRQHRSQLMGRSVWALSQLVGTGASHLPHLAVVNPNTQPQIRV